MVRGIPLAVLVATLENQENNSNRKTKQEDKSAHNFSVSALTANDDHDNVVKTYACLS